MISILADEHIPRSLVQAVRARVSAADIVRVQDVGLRSAEDSALLEWAATNDRIILTEDRSTLVPQAHERVASGLPMPGVLAIRPGAEWSQVIDDLVLILICELPDDLVNQAVYIPI